MQFDSNRKYLLSRPRGGFNDTMVQIEKSILYAAEYGRTLVLDTSRSGLRKQFNSIFEFYEEPPCRVIHWTTNFTEAFDSESSVYPPQLKHRVSTYETEWNTAGHYFSDCYSKCAINFDHSKDNAAKILVYEQAAGGPASLNALNRLCLRPEIATVIAARLNSIGRGYDAVHIRHTDYKTDFEAFLKKLCPALRGRRVLICSDSYKAKSAAASILHPSTVTLSVADIPDIDGMPLHVADEVDFHCANIDLLCDLIAMSLADNFYFTHLSGGNDNGVRYSGFSLLADLLKRNPHTVRRLLSSAEPSIVAPLFERVSSPFDPVRRLHVLDCYRWNFGAKRKAFRRYRRAKTRHLTPDKIGPSYFENF